MGSFTGGDLAVARSYDAWFTRGWGRYAWRVESTALRAACQPVNGWRVADIGCGTGRMAAAFADDGAQVIGVDLDVAMLTVAVPRLPGRLLRADGVRLPLADDTVDVAVTLATLEFTDDPAAVLTEMARITRPGGRVVAATLNPASPWGWLGDVRRHDPYCRARFLSRGDLLSVGGRHGAPHVHGRLIAAEQLPFLAVLGPVLEALGRFLPALGAVQILTIDLKDI